MSINPLELSNCDWQGTDLAWLSNSKTIAEKAKLFDQIAKLVQETDAYWDCEVKSAFMQIEILVNIGTGGKPVHAESNEHECINCENFDLSDNTCLQYNKSCYNDNKECMHNGCADWQQCNGFVPPMNEEEDSE